MSEQGKKFGEVGGSGKRLRVLRSIGVLLIGLLVLSLLVGATTALTIFAFDSAAVNSTDIAEANLPIAYLNESREGEGIQSLYNHTEATSDCKIAFYSDYASISYTSKTLYGLSYYANALRSRGYTVEQIYKPITSSKLDGYDALLIIGLDEYLSSDEKSAIEDFVENQDKGLLLSGGSSSVVSDLAQIFTGGSVAWFGDYTVCDPTDYEVYPKWVKIQTFYDHAITENVNRIIMYKGTNIPAAWYYGGIMGCAYSDDDSWLDEDGDYIYDSGESRGAQPVVATSAWDKIVIVPDSNVFDNSDADGDGIVAFNEYDNDVLGLNIASWLSGCDQTECINPPAVQFDQSTYYEGDTVHATVSSSQSSAYYEIKDCSGVVRGYGYISSGSSSIYYTIPDGSTPSCCYWTICFYWDEDEYTPPLEPPGTGENVSVGSYQCSKCYTFYVCPCVALLEIDDNTCFGYEVWLDGYYQFTEGQDGTPDGYCAFYVPDGYHTITLRKGECSTSDSGTFLCGYYYLWDDMPAYWCNCCNDPDLIIQSITANRSSLCLGDSVSFTVTIKNIGTETADSSIVKYYVGGVEKGSSAVPNLAPGGTITKTYIYK